MQPTEIEKATYSNPPTGQKERVLFVGDFMLVLSSVILLLFARETLALEPTPPPRKPTTTANELHEAMLWVRCDK